MTEGMKFDGDKLRWDLVQSLSLMEYVKVLTYGARKYAPDNWRHVESQRSRYFAALLRHVWAWWLGETHDPESGLHHLAHALCCVTFLMEPELEDTAKSPDEQLVHEMANTELPEGWEFHPTRKFFWSSKYGADVCPGAGGWIAYPWSRPGSCVLGTLDEALDYCKRIAVAVPVSQESTDREKRLADVEAMGKQYAAELVATAEQAEQGAVSEELGRRLLSNYGWKPCDMGHGHWDHPAGRLSMPLEDALKMHGYKLENMVESGHGLQSDTGTVRKPCGFGTPGSRGGCPEDPGA